MFKLKGNVVYLEMLVECFGFDLFCYYFMCLLFVGLDGIFMLEDYVGCINYEFVNDLGNFFNCIIVMVNKYFDGEVLRFVVVIDFDVDLVFVVIDSIENYYK